MASHFRKNLKLKISHLKLNEQTSKMNPFMTFLPIKNIQLCNLFLKNILIMENDLLFFSTIFRKGLA
jgi:hypothetical protein